MLAEAFFHPYIIGCGMHLITPEEKPGTNMSAPRTVRWYELEWTIEAERGGIGVDGTFLPAQKGRLYIRKPGMRAYARNCISTLFIVFDSVYDEQLQSAYIQHPYADSTPAEQAYLRKRASDFSFLNELPLYLDTAEDARFEQIFRQFVELKVQQPPYLFLQQRSLLYQLLGLICHTMHTPDEKTPIQRAVLDIRNWIDIHYAEKISLAKLAQQACFSREYLCRGFGKVVGQSPIDYLISIRLQHARRLLIYTNESIDQIAQLCGFCSAGHFHSCFRQREGCTPHQYRLACRGTVAPS